MTTTDPLGRAWGWVAHLRAGGRTPWLDWVDAAPASARVLPGAQQLELLRRINLARWNGEPSSDADGPKVRLADRVLVAAAAGRGKTDLPLVGAGSPTFGSRPVDPGSLSPHELTRVASVLLAEDLVESGVVPQSAPPARLWRRRYRLLGDPLLVGRLRDELVARGRPQGGHRPHIVVAAGALDEMLAHTWTQRCFEHGTTPWTEWLRTWHERDQLPTRVDLGECVRRWGGRGPSVKLVTDLELLPRHLGVRQLPEVRVPGADQAELARRIAAVVGLRVPRPVRLDLMRTLQARMPGRSVGPAAVSAAELPWVEAASARLTREMHRAGYSVVGDLADLAPRKERPAPAGTSGNLDQQVLDLAVGMLVDQGWRTSEGRVEQ